MTATKSSVLLSIRVIFRAKHFLQCLWKLNIPSIDTIDTNVKQEWLDFALQLSCLEHISIPRYSLLETIAENQQIVFCDVFQKGFAPAVFSYE